MEMLASHLKQTGAFVCRTLSFEQCSFELMDAIMDKEAQAIYDRAAEFWIVLRELVEQGLDSDDHEPHNIYHALDANGNPVGMDIAAKNGRGEEELVS